MKYQTLEKCVGCKLGCDIIDDNDILILKKGTMITEHYVERLRNFGIFCLCIDDEISEGIDISQPASEDTLKKSHRAIAEYDVDKTFNAATRLVDEIIANSAILENGYHILKTYDENTCEHSVAVAINALTMGIPLGLNIVKLNNLSVGGMLHDIGKSRVPIEILNKSGQLDADERLEMQKHPQYGYDILNQDILIPATVKAIVLQHHENWDGTGYPKQLKEHNVYELAAIIHICDVYDALVSKRTYKEAFSFHDTIEYMKSQSGKMFSPYYLKYFLMYVPIYHTGTIVKLSNGEEAIVVKNNKGDMTRPTVRVISNMSDIDLRQHEELYIIS